MLSEVACLTPFSDFNQSPRNMYQCQVRAVSSGTCHTSYLLTLFGFISWASSQSLLCYYVSAQHDVILTWAKETLWLAAITLAHESLATITRPLKLICKIFTVAKTFLDVFTCKMKHLQKCFRAVRSRRLLNIFANVLFYMSPLCIFKPCSILLKIFCDILQIF